MKYIKFTLSNKQEFTVTIEQAKEILQSSQQLVPIKENNKWDGRVINKAFVISTCWDREYENDIELLERVDSLGSLPGPSNEAELKNKERIDNIIDETKKKFGWDTSSDSTNSR